MWEEYEQRWILVETYESKIEEFNEESLAGNLDLTDEDLEEMLGVDEMNMELFWHTNKLETTKFRFPNGNFAENQNTELAKFVVLDDMIREMTGQDLKKLDEINRSKEIDLLDEKIKATSLGPTFGCQPM